MAQSVRCLDKQGNVVRLSAPMRDLLFSDATIKITERNRLVERGLFPLGLKEPEREANRPPHPSSAEVKNEWNYTSTPLYAFMPCTGTTWGFHFKFYACLLLIL